jgi:hypothetical protein
LNGRLDINGISSTNGNLSITNSSTLGNPIATFYQPNLLLNNGMSINLGISNSRCLNITYNQSERIDFKIFSSFNTYGGSNLQITPDNVNITAALFKVETQVGITDTLASFFSTVALFPAGYNPATIRVGNTISSNGYITYNFNTLSVESLSIGINASPNSIVIYNSLIEITGKTRILGSGTLPNLELKTTLSPDGTQSKLLFSTLSASFPLTYTYDATLGSTFTLGPHVSTSAITIRDQSITLDGPLYAYLIFQLLVFCL